MKYHLYEHETFREILKVREDLKQQYIKTEKNLLDKKEKLFRNKDFTKWGYVGDGGVRYIEQIQDKLNKESAFTFML